MQAAADQQDHRQVFELYRRWKSEHVHWQNKHLAAVACFNLGRYKRAASLWTPISAEHRFFTLLQKAAFLLERGTVPPFALEYEIPSLEILKAIETASCLNMVLPRYHLKIQQYTNPIFNRLHSY
ncbi:MAG: hypothetical protein HPY89_10235 [Pelotomaculum sp.]|nr:hypothetical protein [Pelotomaculum sp.]